MAPRRREPYRILLPLANPRTARDLVRIGAGVATAPHRDHRPRHRRGARGRQPLRGRAPGPHRAAPAAARPRLRRRGGRRAPDDGPHRSSRSRRRHRGGRPRKARISSSSAGAVRARRPRSRAPRRRRPRPALAGAEPRPPSVFTTTIDAVVRESPCDIAVVKQRGLDQVRSILVPVRGGPHAELAIRLARDLGKRFGAQVVVMHIVPKGIGERALAREQEALDAFVREHGGAAAREGPAPRGRRACGPRSSARRRTTTSWSWAPARNRPSAAWCRTAATCSARCRRRS